MVAKIVVAVPAGTLAGAVTCREKVLAMVICADACLDGSATLCAVKIAVGVEARIAGAV